MTGGRVPAEARQHLEEAFGLVAEGMLGGAMRECDQALELAPNWAEAHELRGQILEQMGFQAKAEMAYERANAPDAVSQDIWEELEQGEGELVTVAAYSFPSEALIAKGRLEADGIPAFVADDQTVTMNWALSNAVGGVKVQVRSSDAQDAYQILHPDGEMPYGMDGEDAIDLDPRCPKCGSVNIYYGKYSRHWALISWLFVVFPFLLGRDKWRCAVCSASWEAE